MAAVQRALKHITHTIFHIFSNAFVFLFLFMFSCAYVNTKIMTANNKHISKRKKNIIKLSKTFVFH